MTYQICRFEPGHLMALPGALHMIPLNEMRAAIQRHVSGDWGDVCESDKRSNERALKTGERLVSISHLRRPQISDHYGSGPVCNHRPSAGGILRRSY